MSDAKPYSASASQAERYLGCPRKWAYSRRRPRTQTQWAAFGERCHTLREHWLLHHAVPDPETPEGLCVLAGLHLWPLPGTPGMLVEHPFHYDFWGLPITGRIDLMYGYEPGRIVVIDDLKTTGDLDNAKTPDDLANDPQRIIYAHYVASVLRVEYVAAQWTYCRRKPPQAQPVVYVERARDTEERFAILYRDTLRHMQARANDPIESFDRNLDHCGAFGGCPYRAECHVGVSPIAIAAATLNRPRKERKTK